MSLDFYSTVNQHFGKLPTKSFRYTIMPVAYTIRFKIKNNDIESLARLGSLQFWM